VCHQLINRDNAFPFLYNIGEGEGCVECTLKVSCCGTVTASAFVAGVHFTAKMLYAFGKRGNWMYNVEDGSSDLSL
jgi:hypothetical protein